MNKEEINGPAILSTYKTYLGAMEAFEVTHQLLINGNTATKVEAYRRFQEQMSIFKPSVDLANTGDEFLNNCILFLSKYFDEIDGQLYKITSDAISNSDDPDLLNEITR